MLKNRLRRAYGEPIIAPKGHFRRAGRFPKYNRFQHVRPTTTTDDFTRPRGEMVERLRHLASSQRLEGVWE